MTGWKEIAPYVLAETGVAIRDGLVRVPYRLPDGTEHNAKLFAPGGRSWWERRGVEQVPFGLELVPPNTCSGRAFAKRCILFIVEGESDALAARQAFWPAGPIAVVLGIPGAGAWRPSWRTYLEPFPVAYVLGDGDGAGSGLNASVNRDAPWARPVRLPAGEDVRSILQQQGAVALEPYLFAADADARLRAAVALAPDLNTCAALLRGEAVAA